MRFLDVRLCALLCFLNGSVLLFRYLYTVLETSNSVINCIITVPEWYKNILFHGLFLNFCKLSKDKKLLFSTEILRFPVYKQYNSFLVYCRELAPGTVSLTGDRTQGDDSKHDSHYTYIHNSMCRVCITTFS